MFVWRATGLACPSSVYTLYARSDPAEDLIRNRSDRRSHFTNVDAILGAVRRLLRSDDDDLVAGRDVEAGDVGHQHVHAHRTDDRRAAAPNEDRPASGEAEIEAVGVSRRYDRDGRRSVRCEPDAVADTLARTHAFHGDDAADERHRWRQRKRR